MTRLRFASAQEVFEAFPNAQQDIQAAPSAEPPLKFLAKLPGSKAPEDAISFCAYVLGRREAVWWSAQTIRAMGCPRGRDEEKALLIAEAWVREPEEHRRRAALDAGFNGDRELPGVWVALGAGTAGGNLTMGGMSGPPCTADMTARAVRAAVLIALSKVPARDRAAHITSAVGMCQQLANQNSS
ncbi:DUF6931 family protein [Terrarubrum flagellatum]|uniref:DUF6931 family protein n=1 Tax=Terrirubrum flagellatum TaxID=2895980 RepID=UPI003144D76E